MNIPNFFPKDPNDYLDYAMDFSAQMTLDSDTLASVVSVTATPSGLTIGEAMLRGTTQVQCWIGGGVSGTYYTVQFSVQTTSGRTYNRSGMLEVISR